MSQRAFIANNSSVSASEWASIYRGILGASGILTVYSNLLCTKVNDNTVRLAAGIYNLSGYLLGVDKGATEDFTIDSGTAGYNRYDLIIAEFIRDGDASGDDKLWFRVLKGTPTTGTPTDPTLTQNDINASGTTRQETIARVRIAGTSITQIDYLAPAIDTPQVLATKADSAVHKTGTETVANVKTFTSSPIVPTPTTDMQACTKKYVDDNTVSLFGEQTIVGVKTFYDVPAFPTMVVNPTLNSGFTGTIEVRRIGQKMRVHIDIAHASFPTALTEIVSAANWPTSWANPANTTCVPCLLTTAALADGTTTTLGLLLLATSGQLRYSASVAGKVRMLADFEYTLNNYVT